MSKVRSRIFCCYFAESKKINKNSQMHASLMGQTSFARAHSVSAAQTQVSTAQVFHIDYALCFQESLTVNY